MRWIHLDIALVITTAWTSFGSALVLENGDIALESGIIHSRANAWEPGPSLDMTEINGTRLRELPECAGLCINQVLPNYGCNFDGGCYCDNGNLTASMDACLGANCTFTDNLAAQRFQADTCSIPVRDRGGLTRRLNWAMFVLATFFVFGRFLSRVIWLGGSGFSWDDWIVLFCYILLVPTDVTAELEVQSGLGKDMYMLSVDNIVDILQMFYLGELFYNMIVMLTKVSLILLYLRIWSADSVNSVFRITCWILVGILNATWIAGVFAIIFQCTPVRYAWLAVTGAVQGTCIKLEAFTYTYGALNICYDVIVFFLPVHSLLKLKVPWPRKVGLCSVFLVGFLVTICSIVRLQYLVRLGSSKNISWDFQYIGMWSLVEANFSVVCCCMPAMAGLIQRLWSRSNDSSSYASRSSPKPSLDENTSQSSPRYDPTYIESMLEKGEMDGRQTKAESRKRKVDEMESKHERTPSTAAEMLHSGPPGSDDLPASAILYRHSTNGRPCFVEIAHETPTEASTTILSYRDHRDVLHEVEIIDRPQGRIPGPSTSTGSSRHSQLLQMRQNALRAKPSNGLISPGSPGRAYSANTTPRIQSTSTSRRTSRIACTLFGGGV